MSQRTTAADKPTREDPDLLGSLAVLLATAFWGASSVFIKLILADQGISVLALAFWRDLATFSVLVLALALFRPAWLKVGRADLGWLAALGASIGALHIFWNLAILLNGAAVAIVQQAAMPVIVAVVAWIAWREPLTGRKVAAIGLTFFGTVLVSGLSILSQADLSLLGFVVGLGLAGVYAAWNMIIKRVRREHNLFTTLTYGFGFGTLVLLPLQFFTRQPQSVSVPILLYFAGLILIATIGGFSIYAFAVGRLQASIATILAMAEIPVVAVYAYLLLGERMTVDQILGALLVIAGVLLLSWRRRAEVPLPGT